MKTVKLKECVEKISVRAEKITSYQTMQVFGVSNKDGITITDHPKSKDLSKYLYLSEHCFAYNPYRINVGSIGLAPSGSKGLVSPAYVVFKTKDDVLLPELLLDFLKSKGGLFQIQKYARGTVRKALRYEDLCEIEIPYLTLDDQKNAQIRKTSIRNALTPISTEITHQQSLLKKLRQSILQDAISGKLTKKWREENPDVEPASELFARIKAEKDRLVKERKIRKQKPLPSITDDEIPFELPDGWVWCRLGDLPIAVEYGTSSKTSDSGNVGVFAMGHIQDGKLNHGNFKYLSDSNKDLPKLYLKHNDLLFNRTNSWELVGKTAIYKGEDNKFSFASYLIRLQFIYCNAVFYNYVLNSKYYRESQIEPQIIKQCGQANFNGTKLQNTVVPLPPEIEFKIIVSKVEKLLAYCNGLEKQIGKSQQDSELLMQAVLKEAFEG